MAIGLFWFGALVSRSATYYVATNGAGDGSSWELATNNIQGAINRATTTGDIVLVSNGVYQTGGVTNWPAGTVLTNRVAITNAITVRSANNDPTNTIIKGKWASDGNTNGLDAVRCVYMANGSALIGFTLTNGATLSAVILDNNRCGGGVWCSGNTPIISNCVIAGNSASYGGGGTYQGTLYGCTVIGNLAAYGAGVYVGIMSNCTLIGNISAVNGGGTYQGTLYGSTLIGNSAPSGGGGASGAALFNCTLIGNSSPSLGGGANGGTLSNCTLIGNLSTSAGSGLGGGANGSTLYNSTIVSNVGIRGGGAKDCILYNCTLTGNVATNYGGGAQNSTLYNCLFAGNRAVLFDSGGAKDCILYNCTVVSNSAGSGGGGVSAGTSVNSIVYFNMVGAVNSNWGSTVSFSNSCTTPTNAVWSVGNITNDPIFVDRGAGNYRLSVNSPGVNAGTNYSWMTNSANVHSKDMDGRARIRYGTVDMGAYETIYAGTIFMIR